MFYKRKQNIKCRRWILKYYSRTYRTGRTPRRKGYMLKLWWCLVYGAINYGVGCSKHDYRQFRVSVNFGFSFLTFQRGFWFIFSVLQFWIRPVLNSTKSKNENHFDKLNLTVRSTLNPGAVFNRSSNNLSLNFKVLTVMQTIRKIRLNSNGKVIWTNERLLHLWTQLMKLRKQSLINNWAWTGFERHVLKPGKPEHLRNT